MKKMPPIEKIYEAYSAIVDDRISLDEVKAVVTSSNLAKKYLVAWKENRYLSNDSASYYQGYPGYPVLAVLMLQGKLPYKEEYAVHFKNVPWNQLNNEHKRDYAEVVELLLTELREKGISTEEIVSHVQEVYQELELLDLEIVKKL